MLGLDWSAAAYRTPFTMSMAGVPVMPYGLILPHGKPLTTGLARCWLHSWPPESVLKAYTVLFSVATYTLVPTTSGCAYMLASTDALHANAALVAGASSRSTPECAAFCWYIGHPEATEATGSAPTA